MHYYVGPSSTVHLLSNRVLQSRNLRIHCRRLQEVGRNTSPTATFNVPLAGLASRQGRSLSHTDADWRMLGHQTRHAGNGHSFLRVRGGRRPPCRLQQARRKSVSI